MADITAEKQLLRDNLAALGFPTESADDEVLRAASVVFLNQLNEIAGLDSSQKNYDADTIIPLKQALHTNLSVKDSDGLTGLDKFKAIATNDAAVLDKIIPIGGGYVKTELNRIHEAHKGDPKAAARASFEYLATQNDQIKDFIGAVGRVNPEYLDDLPKMLSVMGKAQDILNSYDALAENGFYDQAPSQASMDKLDSAKTFKDAIQLVEGVIGADQKPQWGAPEQQNLKAFVTRLQSDEHFGKDYNGPAGVWNSEFAAHLASRIEALPTELTPEEKKSLNIKRSDASSSKERLEEDRATLAKAVEEELKRRAQPFNSPEHAQQFLQAMETLSNTQGVELLSFQDSLTKEKASRIVEEGLMTLAPLLNDALQSAREKVGDDELAQNISNLLTGGLLNVNVPEIRNANGELDTYDQSSLQSVLKVLGHQHVLGLQDGQPDWKYSAVKGEQILARLRDTENPPAFLQFLNDQQKEQLKKVANDQKLDQMILALNYLADNGQLSNAPISSATQGGYENSTHDRLRDEVWGAKKYDTILARLEALETEGLLFDSPLLESSGSRFSLVTQDVIKHELSRLEDAGNMAAVKLFDAMTFATSSPYNLNSMLHSSDRVDSLSSIDPKLSLNKKLETFYNEAHEAYEKNPGEYASFEDFMKPMLRSVDALPFGDSEYKKTMDDLRKKSLETANGDGKVFADTLQQGITAFVQEQEKKYGKDNGHEIVPFSNTYNVQPRLHPKLQDGSFSVTSEGKTYNADDVIKIYNEYQLEHGHERDLERFEMVPIDSQRFVIFEDDNGEKFVAGIDRTSMTFSVESTKGLSELIQQYYKPYTMLGLEDDPDNGIIAEEYLATMPKDKLNTLMDEHKLNESQRQTIQVYRDMYDGRTNAKNPLNLYEQAYAKPALRAEHSAFSLIYQNNNTALTRLSTSDLKRVLDDTMGYGRHGGQQKVNSLAEFIRTKDVMTITENGKPQPPQERAVVHLNDTSSPVHIPQQTPIDIKATKPAATVTSGPQPDFKDRQDLLDLAHYLRASGPMFVDEKMSTLLDRYDGRTDLKVGNYDAHAKHIAGTAVTDNPDGKPQIAYFDYVYDHSKEKPSGIIKTVTMDDNLLKAHAEGRFNEEFHKMARNGNSKFIEILDKNLATRLTDTSRIEGQVDEERYGFIQGDLNRLALRLEQQLDQSGFKYVTPTVTENTVTAPPPSI